MNESKSEDGESSLLAKNMRFSLINSCWNKCFNCFNKKNLPRHL